MGENAALRAHVSLTAPYSFIGSRANIKSVYSTNKYLRTFLRTVWDDGIIFTHRLHGYARFMGLGKCLPDWHGFRSAQIGLTRMSGRGTPDM